MEPERVPAQYVVRKPCECRHVTYAIDVRTNELCCPNSECRARLEYHAVTPMRVCAEDHEAFETLKADLKQRPGYEAVLVWEEDDLVVLEWSGSGDYTTELDGLANPPFRHPWTCPVCARERNVYVQACDGDDFGERHPRVYRPEFVERLFNDARTYHRWHHQQYGEMSAELEQMVRESIARETAAVDTIRGWRELYDMAAKSRDEGWELVKRGNDLVAYYQDRSYWKRLFLALFGL